MTTGNWTEFIISSSFNWIVSRSLITDMLFQPLFDLTSCHVSRDSGVTHLLTADVPEGVTHLSKIWLLLSVQSPNLCLIAWLVWKCISDDAFVIRMYFIFGMNANLSGVLMLRLFVALWTRSVIHLIYGNITGSLCSFLFVFPPLTPTDTMLLVYDLFCPFSVAQPATE